MFAIFLLVVRMAAGLICFALRLAWAVLRLAWSLTRLVAAGLARLACGRRARASA